MNFVLCAEMCVDNSSLNRATARANALCHSQPVPAKVALAVYYCSCVLWTSLVSCNWQWYSISCWIYNNIWRHHRWLLWKGRKDLTIDHCCLDSGETGSCLCLTYPGCQRFFFSLGATELSDEAAKARRVVQYSDKFMHSIVLYYIHITMD